MVHPIVLELFFPHKYKTLIHTCLQFVMHLVLSFRGDIYVIIMDVRVCAHKKIFMKRGVILRT